MLKSSPDIITAGHLANKVDALTLYTAVVNNLIPVTLGNIVGGGIFVGMLYWYCYPQKIVLSGKKHQLPLQ